MSARQTPAWAAGPQSVSATSTPRTPLPVDLALNENPFGPSPLAIQAIRDELGGLSRYTGTEAAALLQQIAAAERVSADQIVLGEVLETLGVHLALRGGPGGEILYSTPGYTALVDSAQSAGGVAVPVPLDDRLENNLPALRARVGERTRALFLVNPHNPSGTVSDPASFLAFVHELSRRTLVIVDEAYLEFTDDFPGRTCAACVRAGDNVAVFRTFSKVHGLAALPFGYAILPAREAEWLDRLGVGHPRSLNRLSVVAAAASLRDASYIGSVRRKVAVERDRWVATLRSLKLRFAEPHGNFVFFETGLPHQAVAAALLTSGVDIGRAFPPLDRWARISIGLPEENALAQVALRRLVG
jgi:histidinol-phosphate aminotransferase